jgi:hypothetical protein
MAAKGLAEATVDQLMVRLDALERRVASAPVLAASVSAVAKERDEAVARDARRARELEAALSRCVLQDNEKRM